MFLKLLVFIFFCSALEAKLLKLRFDSISVKKNITSYSTGLKFVPKIYRTINDLVIEGSGPKKKSFNYYYRKI